MNYFKFAFPYQVACTYELELSVKVMQCISAMPRGVSVVNLCCRLIFNPNVNVNMGLSVLLNLA